MPVGRPAPGLFDDHLKRRDVPRVHDGIDRDLATALGDEHVLVEVAEAALYLASDASSGITGERIKVDAGRL